MIKPIPADLSRLARSTWLSKIHTGDPPKRAFWIEIYSFVAAGPRTCVLTGSGATSVHSRTVLRALANTISVSDRRQSLSEIFLAIRASSTKLWKIVAPYRSWAGEAARPPTGRLPGRLLQEMFGVWGSSPGEHTAQVSPATRPIPTELPCYYFIECIRTCL